MGYGPDRENTARSSGGVIRARPDSEKSEAFRVTK